MLDVFHQKSWFFRVYSMTRWLNTLNPIKSPFFLWFSYDFPGLTTKNIVIFSLISKHLRQIFSQATKRQRSSPRSGRPAITCHDDSQAHAVYLGISMGWLQGKSAGNHRFSHEKLDFPVFFSRPINWGMLFQCTLWLSREKLWKDPASYSWKKLTPFWLGHFQ